ncbi:MAG: cytidylate kinase-like family protein, partial [Evtepia sp.]
TADDIRRTDQNRSASFLYSLYMNTQILPMSDQIFLVQSEIIRDLAEHGPCVIVGRCADYILRNKAYCMNVFIHAPLAQRITRAVEEYKDEASNMEDYIRKQDKRRASYYNYFSQNKWGSAQNYHLSISSSFGISETVDLLKTAAMKFPGGAN